MDTAGQERFKAINTQYYRGADCCLLVYDITDKKSFEEIKKYYNQEIKDKCPKHVKVILLGNKTDLENERKISSEEASELALENNYIFMETSCLEDNNVADAFETLIENTYRETIINGRGKNNLNETICHEKTKIQKYQCKC
jgi:small GTP-binding protein